MTATPSQLPLTINGRSPFDGIRLRWGGLGAVGLGIGLPFTAEPAGIVFGILFFGLGLATWILSSFGGTWWYDIPVPQRYVVATGAIIGMSIFIVFVGGFLVMAWVLTMFANS